MDLMASSDATVSISVSPFKGLGALVVDFDIAGDLAGEIGFGSKDAAGDQIALNFGAIRYLEWVTGEGVRDGKSRGRAAALR
jgi:hypothetical protein